MRTGGGVGGSGRGGHRHSGAPTNRRRRPCFRRRTAHSELAALNQKKEPPVGAPLICESGKYRNL